jgi:hypothetical protein
MSINLDSQNFESYLPVYDFIPEQWEQSRPVLIEYFKKISNAVNIREIGWLLDEELISGKQYIPGTNNNQAFRTVFRKCFDLGALTAGTNSVAHGITIDTNFSLIDLWGAATDSVGKTGTPINQPNIYYDQTNIYVVTTVDFTNVRAFI